MSVIGITTVHADDRDSLMVVRENAQQNFRETIPAGDYSGITWLGGYDYAVVSDKSANGFFVFHIVTDSITGAITSAENSGFRGQDDDQLDEEGIAFIPGRNTVLISCEKDSRLREYQLDGTPTGNEVQLTEAGGNYGYESLTYDSISRTLWTCTESTLADDGMQAAPGNRVQNRIRLQSFDENFVPIQQYAYLMDEPVATATASNYAMGVSELTAMGDSTLLVLEREFYVPHSKLGAFVVNKLYRVRPDVAYAVSVDKPLDSTSPYLPKTLISSWRTTLTLFNHSLANYEGMCLGPTLPDGSRTLVLVSDSQHQYAGVLKDWLKTLVISKAERSEE